MYGVTAVTCVVAETPGRVVRMQPADPAIVREQMRVLLANFPVRAIKTGLLCNAPIVAAVSRVLRRLARRTLVVDPVMIATSGRRLLDAEAVSVYERELFPLATVITPNLDEATQLLGDSIPGLAGLRRAARELARRYRVPVLLKGGHLEGSRAIDVLSDGDSLREFSSAFVPNVKTHGTGCTYSAAITAELARGAPLEKAVRAAKKQIFAAIKNHFTWKSGHSSIAALNPTAQQRYSSN